MLLLVTIVLVLIAVITLVIGIFADSLALIFVSIGSSVLAAVVLGVLSQMNKRRDREEAEAPRPVAQPAPAPTAAAPTAPAPPAPAAPEPAEDPTLVQSVTAAASDDLPIEGYDSLRVADILPKLAELDLDQLEQVAQHEESAKNRTSILNRIDELMDELEAQEAGVATAATAAAPTPAPTPEPTPAPASVAAAAEGLQEAAVSGGFPIPDYDSRSEADIIGLLGDLDADELEEVAEYEETHANRDRVLDAIDDRLDELEGIAPQGAPAVGAAPAPTPGEKVVVVEQAKRPAPKKVAAKKAATKATKTAAKVTKATKAATPAKRAASAATAASPAKAAAKKATAKKAATPAVKKAAATTKKAGAVKKAGAAKKATKATKRT